MTEQYKLFFELEDRLYKGGRPYDSLNDTEKKFYMISWLMMQVFNGGWYQWYDSLDEDKRTERVEDALEALRAIGAREALVLVQRAVAYLKKKNPGPIDRRLDKLNEEFWSLSEDLTGLAQSWAEQRLDEFAT